MNYYVFDYGWAYYVFLVWFAVLCVYCFYLLFSSSKSEKLDPAKRQQLKFVFWGVLVALVSGSINFMLDIVTIPFYYNLLVPFYLVFVGYAVIKNQLFGIKVIVTELLVAVMGFILLVFSFQMPDRWLSLAAAGIFIVYCFIGYLLIKTTMGEVNAKENLESKVRERTRDLQASNEALEQSKAVAEERAQELEKWYKLTIGREVRMAELKEKIKEMEDKKQ
jgi:signal transduction histidine kinase